VGFTRDINEGNSMKKSTHYEIVGCNHRFTCDEEKHCSTCELTRTDPECMDSIAVGERAYIYVKVEK